MILSEENGFLNRIVARLSNIQILWRHMFLLLLLVKIGFFSQMK